MGAEQSAELPTPAPPAPEKIVHDGFDGEAEMSKDVDDIPKLVDLSALPQSAVLSLTDAPAEEPAFEAPTGSPMVPDDVAPEPSPVKQPIIIETSRTGMSAGSLQGELGGVNFKQGMRVELVGLAGYEKSEAVITSVATSGSRKGQLYVICGKKAMRICTPIYASSH